MAVFKLKTAKLCSKSREFFLLFIIVLFRIEPVKQSLAAIVYLTPQRTYEPSL
jgi:hypothetical protein